jgi:hypothetical protein
MESFSHPTALSSPLVVNPCLPPSPHLRSWRYWTHTVGKHVIFPVWLLFSMSAVLSCCDAYHWLKDSDCWLVFPPIAMSLLIPSPVGVYLRCFLFGAVVNRIWMAVYCYPEISPLRTENEVWRHRLCHGLMLALCDKDALPMSQASVRAASLAVFMVKFTVGHVDWITGLRTVLISPLSVRHHCYTLRILKEQLLLQISLET